MWSRAPLIAQQLRDHIVGWSEFGFAKGTTVQPYLRARPG